MIFHKEKQLCFLNPTKTGTKTLRHELAWAGWHVGPHYHVPYRHAVEQFPNLLNYKIFSFLRNPLDRFISCTLFLKQNFNAKLKIEKLLERKRINVSVADMPYEVVADLFDDFDSEFEIMFFPQSIYFSDNVEALDFENFESELRRVIELSGTTKRSISRLNQSTDFGKSVITDKVRAFVREKYADDYALFKDRFGKEPA